jgi:hypothetical protein
MFPYVEEKQILQMLLDQLPSIGASSRNRSILKKKWWLEKLYAKYGDQIT